MACLAWDSQFQRLNLQFSHKSSNALGDGTKVVVVHLLVLGRVVTHKSAPCQQQVWAGRVESFVNEEVLLFPAKVACYLLYSRVEVLANLCGGYVDCMEGTQQRSLVIEGFTSI